METLLVTSEARPHNACLALIARRAYRFAPGIRALPVGEPPALPLEPEYAKSTNEGARPRLVEEPAAEAFGKPLTDVLLRGTAHAPAVTDVVDTALEVGAARKAVRVFGERRIVVKPGGELAFTEPRPFKTQQLTWDHAYGGRDMHAESLMFPPHGSIAHGGELDLHEVMRVLYMRNGAGRGYYVDIDRDRLHGALAPSLEDPTDPITPSRLLNERTTDWIDRPIAACYEPIDWFTFPRVQFLIPPVFDTPTRPVHELTTGALLRDDLGRKFDLTHPIVNARLYNCAPSGLAVARLAGDETVRMWNLHEARALIEFGLPADRPAMALVLPGVGRRELAPALQTVLIEPDRDRVTLTWAGMLDVAMAYPDEALREIERFVSWERELET